MSNCLESMRHFLDTSRSGLPVYRTYLCAQRAWVFLVIPYEKVIDSEDSEAWGTLQAIGGIS
jgi:hypothetical protein